MKREQGGVAGHRQASWGGKSPIQCADTGEGPLQSDIVEHKPRNGSMWPMLIKKVFMTGMTERMTLDLGVSCFRGAIPFSNTRDLTGKVEPLAQ